MRCLFVASFSPTVGSFMVDNATSKWIPIVSNLSQGSVLGPLLFILYANKIFELFENRFYDYGVDSTLLTVVLKPADRPAVATSLTGTWLRFRSSAITGACY